MESECVNRYNYRQTGFWLLNKMLKFWGIRLDAPVHKPVINKWLAGFILVISSSTLTLTSSIIYLDTVKRTKDFDYESFYLWVLITCSYASSIVTYVFVLRAAKDYRIFYRSISSEVNEIADDMQKKNLIRQIKIQTATDIITPVTMLLCWVVLAIVKPENWIIETAPDSLVSYYIYIIIFGNATLFLMASFYIFSNCNVVSICKMLTRLIDIYLTDNDESETAVDLWTKNPRSNHQLIKKLIYHKKISLIVNAADKVCSNFLMVSLGAEIVIGISIMKLATIKKGQFSNLAFFNFFQLIIFAWKAIHCSNVNSKLKSSVALRKPSTKIFDQTPSPDDQRNYIIYLSEQIVSNAELTYGGFFPVRKSFIFTIAGTAITYALIFNELN
ncbi:hypothetical protein CHUAL_003568 [Chamberlinius hualienensis]